VRPPLFLVRWGAARQYEQSHARVANAQQFYPGSGRSCELRPYILLVWNYRWSVVITTKNSPCRDSSWSSKKTKVRRLSLAPRSKMMLRKTNPVACISTLRTRLHTRHEAKIRSQL
jgi:hypothetical protein